MLQLKEKYKLFATIMDVYEFERFSLCLIELIYTLVRVAK
jgi:hypothetical protein